MTLTDNLCRYEDK